MRMAKKFSKFHVIIFNFFSSTKKGDTLKANARSENKCVSNLKWNSEPAKMKCPTASLSLILPLFHSLTHSHLYALSASRSKPLHFLSFLFPFHSAQHFVRFDIKTATSNKETVFGGMPKQFSAFYDNIVTYNHNYYNTNN